MADLSRRKLLRGAVAGAALIPLVHLDTRSAHAAELDPNGPLASGIGYVEDATSVERPAHAGGTPGEEQFCRTCVLYSGDEAQGACGAVGGQIVKGGGWCKIWAPKG